MKTLSLFVFWISSIAITHAAGQPFQHNFEDLILRETQEIQEAEINKTADLSLKYINRAESYIVAGKFKNALEDLEKGHEVSWHLNQRNVEQRILVDMMVAYAYLGDDEKALSATERFQNLFYSSDNHNSKKGRLCNDEAYVSGPEQAPTPTWCRETVNSTANSLIGLVKVSSVSKGAKESIEFVINQIRESGLRCCQKGGRWKECVGPLARRYVEWQASGVHENPWN